MLVLAILPCRGRKEITLECVKRLKYTSDGVSFKLVTVSGQEDKNIVLATEKHGAVPLVSEKPKLTYWEALELATSKFNDIPIIANLSNDILAGKDWLRRGLISYDQKIGRTNHGLIGFNGDSHGFDNSCHFLIHRNLLNKYGGWPTWYKHNFGDAELCTRAIEDKVYYKDPWALLFHNHAYFYGQERDDAIYKEGREYEQDDEKLFNERKAARWPTIGKNTVSPAIATFTL